MPKKQFFKDKQVLYYNFTKFCPIGFEFSTFTPPSLSFSTSPCLLATVLKLCMVCYCNKKLPLKFQLVFSFSNHGNPSEEFDAIVVTMNENLN